MRLKSKYEIGDIPHSEYPRPQFKRDSFINLNGLWGFAKAKTSDTVSEFSQKILVPFSPETLNSGIPEGFTLGIDEKLVYQRTFNFSKNENQAVYLHFGAVDQECTVYVNAKKVGQHRGGYTPFSFDITDAVIHGENTVLVECTDKTELSHGARGKQSSNPGKIWYTPQSGIWQTVWLEAVPLNHIKDITVKAHPENNTVSIVSDSLGKQIIKVYDGDALIINREFLNKKVDLVYDFELWSPETPKLYTFTVENEFGDKVESYFGVRSYSMSKDEKGVARLFLNGKPYFMNGVLDQGYYSDGLLTPPSDKAMYDDVKLMKDMGYNMIRKHIKIEPMRWYYYCDLLGIIVWQDFVNGGGEYKFTRIGLLPFLGFKHDDSDYEYFSRENMDGRNEYLNAMEETVSTLKNVVSIGVWVPFNEGWGQFDSYEITQKLISIDDTRIIDSVSGWYDQGVDETTMRSLHTYYTPLKVPKDKRPVVLSEFGGYSMKILDHVYSEKEFGYKIFNSKEKLSAALEKLYVKKLLPLIGKGLCAAVYTQLSDVEDEINGLITFDREVVKVDVKLMQKLNAALYEEASKIK